MPALPRRDGEREEPLNEDPVEFFATHDKWCAAYLLTLRHQLVRTVVEQRDGLPWVRFDFADKVACEKCWNDYRSGKGSVTPGAMRQAFYAIQGEMKNAKLDSGLK